MRQMGFDDHSIRWTATFYENSSSVVVVNGETGPIFELGRVVRQGCPLAPYLFLIYIDALGHILNDKQYDIETI